MLHWQMYLNWHSFYIVQIISEGNNTLYIQRKTLVIYGADSSICHYVKVLVSSRETGRNVPLESNTNVIVLHLKSSSHFTNYWYIHHVTWPFLKFFWNSLFWQFIHNLLPPLQGKDIKLLHLKKIIEYKIDSNNNEIYVGRN